MSTKRDQYDLIVFDWEGTLGDTVGQSLCRIASEAGRYVLGTDETPEEIFHRNLLQAARGFFPSWSNEQIERFSLSKIPCGGSQSPEACLLPGAKAIVEHVSTAGIHLAIASNKGLQSLQSALQRTGLQPFFTVIRAAGQTPPKPCPQMLLEILDEFLLKPENALMIGDSVSDIEMAKQIGMDAVGFDFYHQNTAELREAGALVVFDNYQDVAKFLNLPD